MLITTEYNVQDAVLYLINGATRSSGTIISIDVHIDSTGAITERYNVLSNTLSNKGTHCVPSYDIILSTTAIARLTISAIKKG